MLSNNKKQLKATEQEMARLASEIKAIWKKAEDEERETDSDERGEVEAHLKDIETLKAKKADIEAAVKVEQNVQEISRDMGPSEGVELKNGIDSVQSSYHVKSVGEQFVESEGFKAISAQFKAGNRSTFSTGGFNIDTKGTLLEGAGGGGGALAATVPQVVPGVVDKLFEQLTVADLLLSGQASTNSLRYVVEGTATSGAAGVAEGGAKPQSTLGLTTTDEPVKKIATTLVVSDEMLEDAAQVQSYINGRLSLFVRIEEERELLRGAGTNEIIGIMPAGNTRSINIYAGGTAAGSKAVQLFKAMNGQRGSAFVEPDFLVVNPTDWQDIRLATDTAGQFFGGGPFQGPYGNGQNVGASGQLGGADYLWNKPVVVSATLGAGTALVGSSSSAQVWRKGGLTIEATNSHSDYFTQNLVAIRAEQRLALAVYRPTAFTEVRLS